MFTETEAALLTTLTAELETPESVARRLNKPINEVAESLEDMARRGSLRLSPSDQQTSKTGGTRFLQLRGHG